MRGAFGPGARVTSVVADWGGAVFAVWHPKQMTKQIATAPIAGKNFLKFNMFIDTIGLKLKQSVH
jgi:hypothetical protein